MKEWTFLTNHAQVLYLIWREPDLRLIDIAERVGIRERAAHRIVSDLAEAGYLTRSRVGTRNYYTISEHLPLRDELHRQVPVGDILAILDKSSPPGHQADPPTKTA